MVVSEVVATRDQNIPEREYRAVTTEAKISQERDSLLTITLRDLWLVGCFGRAYSVEDRNCLEQGAKTVGREG